MKRLRFLLWLAAAWGCADNKATGPDVEGSFSFETFAGRYKAASQPYQLTDTGLLKNGDTARIPSEQLDPFIADSLLKKLFGKATGIRYIPLRKLDKGPDEAYFITKAVGGGKTVALLTVFGKEKDTAATFPFLVPDADAATTQVSSIENSYSISRNVTRKGKDDVVLEGKDVYAYNNAVNDFTLIMTDVLDEPVRELINPIDTLPRTHRFAGDYGRGKNTIIAIRDGRNASELNVFVHFEREEGACTGELEGTLFLTSTTTAVYRQGGDPCVLEFSFTPKAVTLLEKEGCGAHRGLNCAFDGLYPRKDPIKPKGAKPKGGKK